MKKTRTLPTIAAYILALLFIIEGSLYGPHTIATAATPKEVPKLSSVLQIATDCLKITFDKPADIKKAVDPNNYWIQDLCNPTPMGIGTFGTEGHASSSNTVADIFATITPSDSSNTVFLIKFNDTIPEGAKYRLIACFISAPHGPEYTGNNGALDFVGK